MSDVAPDESGLASGVVNTVVHDGRRVRVGDSSEPCGGRTEWLAAAGAQLNTALNGGYHLAFVLGAIAATIAAALAGAFVRTRQQDAASHPEEAAQSVSSGGR